jgi:hypothetical protein
MMYFHLAFKFYKMKILVSSIIAVLAAIPAFSQKQFEGTIVYKLHSEQEQKEDGQLTILFGKNAIKLKMEDKSGPDKDILLIRIDSGKLYTMNTEEKTYRAKRLIEKEKNEVTLTNKKIAGFNTSAVDLSGGNSVNGLMGSFLHAGTADFYVADSLFYFLPEKYKLAPNIELIFIHNDRIALGVDFIFGGNRTPFDDGEEANMNLNNNRITGEAISVKWESLNENEFSIPADFVKYKDEPMTDSVAMVDSMIRMMDTTSQTRPLKKPSVNTKQPAKPKTKTNSTKTNPVRKPE